MRISTLFRFLIGDRQAILEIASDRRNLWIGLLFVLSAGLAREYDGEYLIAEPWYALIPLGVSLVASFLLFAILYGLVGRRMPVRPSFPPAHRAFLTLFWMTAPLAWLYAIPYERFLSPYDATLANLLTLGVISLWRVVLIIRVVSVLMEIRFLPASFPVILFADVAAMIGTAISPQPIMNLMGGVRHSPEDMLVQSVTSSIFCFGIPVLGVALFGTFLAPYRPGWAMSEITTPANRRTRSTTVLAVISVLAWFLVLPFTQPEQRLRRLVDSNLKQGRIAEALRVMSEHEPEDFPPHFNPRPRQWTGQTKPRMLDVMPVIVNTDVSDWVRTIYMDRFEREITGSRFLLNDEDFASIVPLLEQLPEGPRLAADIRNRVSSRISEDKDDPNVIKLLKLADQHSPADRSEGEGPN